MTQQELMGLFVYEPDTGLLRCVVPGRKPYPWRVIGSGSGYLAATFNKVTYYLHHLVWLYHHGYLPKRIDHENRDTRDCKIGNLRECTSAQNQYNSIRKCNNRSGAKGVVFHKACRSRPWQAKITVDRKIISLGYYATVEMASDAYLKAAQYYAGEFALRGQPQVSV